MSPRKFDLIEISFWTLLKAALLVILIWVLWVLRDVVGVVLLAIVIASAVEPAARWFQRHRIPRVLGVLFVYLATFLIFSITFYLIIPPLFGDILEFLGNISDNIAATLRPDGFISVIFPTVPEALADFLKSSAMSLGSLVGNFTDGIFSAGAVFAGGVLSFVLLIVISFYLSVQERGIENFLRIITPREHEAYILDLWKRSQGKIGRWIQGQLLLGVLVGVIVYLGLTIMGVEYALLLAILSAIFELIPVFGPVMAAIPAIAIASIQSPSTGVMVLLLYVIVQQFENHLIYPLVVRKTVGVPPLLVIISLVVGGKLGGFMGIVLAVPIAAVLVEFLKDLESNKVSAQPSYEK